ncbi:non-ribosomal peptide synthetase [Stappia indica]|uniref:non-ribosomal peptide synthetase n=1 Tax=Stappia indica TaxID=538381 RepID=UPI001CD61408|nr:non-ribosomal peptide synthetase [Stappia indica]MCA1299388.1 amino acid adenylation domain-containing protein [Stappia indica]
MSEGAVTQGEGPERPEPSGQAAGAHPSGGKGRAEGSGLTDGAAARGLQPLSFAQERLWFLDRYNPNSPLYNLPAYLPIPDAAPEDLVRAAIEIIAGRHETIRTRFVAVNGKPYQEVVADAPIELDTRTFAETLSDEAFNGELFQALKAIGDRPFDLSEAPLMRAALLRRGGRDAYLVYCIHHIVSDGWSIGVFQREFTAAYQALKSGARPALPDLPISYAAYAARQRAELSGERVQQRLAVWKERLAGLDLVLPLPADRPRPAHLTFAGATQSFALDPEASGRLADHARRWGVTPFMLFLAAFKVLLFRYTHKREVIVGCPTAARTTTDIEPLIGFFVNSMILKTDLGSEMTFREAVQAVRETTLTALTDEDLPFEKIVEVVQPVRSANINPIFQAMFDFQGTTIARDAPRYEAPARAVNTSMSKFDLTLQMQTLGDRFAGTFEYSTELFEHDTITRLFEGFCAMLEAAAEDPDRPIGHLPVMSAAALEEVICGFNQTQAPAPVSTLQALFEEVAARWPEAEAVRCGERHLSYRELNAHANRFARALRARNLPEGAIIAICMDGSLELPVVVFGILKAGYAYLALDPRYPDGRIAFMLEDCSAALVVTQSELAARFTEGPPVLCVDPGEAFGGDPEAAEQHAENLALSRHPRSLAYVIYTSGSTGRPKGVMIEHQSVANLITQTIGIFGLGPGDRVLQFSSFGFDVSVREIFEALLSGAALVLAPRAQLPAGEELLDLFERERITAVTLPPSLWSSLRHRPLPHLRCAVSGGAALPESVVEKWGADRVFYNAYGPTETTVGTTMHVCTPGAGRPTIGRPLPNYRHYVVDANGEPCPIGVLGELLIGGAGVGRGYMGRPDLTAERFLPDFLSGHSGARLYRTGDLARVLANGEVDYLGRVDDQIELRGFRIEPSEVEEVIKEDSRIRDAAVLCITGRNGEKRIVCYAVAAEPVAEDSILTRARQLLPDYMIPAQLILIPDMPLTPAGKVDRKRLPDAEEMLEAAIARSRSVPAETRLEALTHWIWSMVLGTDTFGVTDNFFELGGHSLLVTQVTSRISEQLEADVPIRLMFDAPTIRAFCQALEETVEGVDEKLAALGVEPGGGPASEMRPDAPAEGIAAPDASPVAAPAAERQASAFERIGKRPAGVPVPLSFAQERLWFLDRFSPSSDAYNGLVGLPVAAPVDVRLLERAVNGVIARHEILRTVFRLEAGAPVQKIRDRLRLTLDVFELPEAQAGASPQQGPVAELIARVAKQPFDLETGPLIRAALAVFADGSGFLILPIHHAICDAWSTGVLQREVHHSYLALLERRKPDLPALDIQYGDFAVWQRERLSGDRLSALVAFWRGTLESAPSLIDLPLDRPRSARRDAEGKVVGFRIDPELHAGLAEIGTELGATTFMVYLAAFAALLSRLAHQDKVVIGTPVSHRDRSEVEPLIGLFTNTLPLTIDCAGAPTFLELIERVKGTALDGFQHKDLPFEKLVEVINPPRQLSAPPIFQVMFSHQKGLQEVTVDEAGGPNVAVTTAKFDLTLFINEMPDGATAVFEYASDLFDRETVSGFADQFHTLLEELAFDPEEIAGRARLSSDAELARLASAGRGEAAGKATVLALLAQAAARFPDQLALVEGERGLSQSAFQALTDGMARALVAAGVMLGDVVAVHLPRGWSQALAFAAILKAGGTYLHILPDLPQARRAFLMADARPKVIIAETEELDLTPEGARVVSAGVLEEAGESGASDAAPLQTPPAGAHGYLVYTSGSTGTPKGVLVPRRVLDGLISWQIGQEGFAPGLRSLQFSAPGFDVALQEMLSVWCSGGTLVVAAPGQLENIGLWHDVLAGEGIERLFLPYVALQQLARVSAERGHAGLALREVVTAGERLVITPEIRALFQTLGHARLVNQYGPSETHVVTAFELTGDPQLWPEVPPIGRPVAGAELHVLDDRLERVPAGCDGELFVGGDTLALGYLNDPERTAEVFLPDPFGERPGGRLYATGDTVRLRHDGMFHFVGRRDGQLKIRGYRIEPGEVEQALTQHPAVLQAVVVPHAFNEGMPELAAYVQPVAGAEPQAQDLAAHLRGLLPDFMIPRAFIPIDEIPRTATGKIDRMGLPEPRRQALAPRDVTLPRSEAEREVAAIWQEVLDLEGLGVHDNFFELGGQSLLAAQVITRLNDRLGGGIALRQIFETPTIAGLAAALSVDAREAEPASTSPGSAAAR